MELDQYDMDAIDDEGEYEELDPARRREIESQMRRRDRELARLQQLRRPGAFIQHGKIFKPPKIFVLTRNNIDIGFFKKKKRLR